MHGCVPLPLLAGQAHKQYITHNSQHATRKKPQRRADVLDAARCYQPPTNDCKLKGWWPTTPTTRSSVSGWVHPWPNPSTLGLTGASHPHPGAREGGQGAIAPTPRPWGGVVEDEEDDIAQLEPTFCHAMT